MSRSSLICALLSLVMLAAIGISANVSRHEDSVRQVAEATYQALVKFAQQVGGRRPYSVTEAGFVKLLPHGKWLKNAYTGEITEPRDWSEMLGGPPADGGVYVSYQETEARCLIVGFGRKGKELFRRVY